jgi:hypothetical protein
MAKACRCPASLPPVASAWTFCPLVIQDQEDILWVGTVAGGVNTTYATGCRGQLAPEGSLPRSEREPLETFGLAVP